MIRAWEHASKGAIFRDNLSIFFHKECRKGEEHRSTHLKMFWEQGILEISNKKKKKNKISKSR